MSDRGREPVLIVTPTFWPERVGTPHYVTDLANALDAHGEPTEVLTNQPYYPAFERFVGYGRPTRRQLLGGVVVRRLPTLVPRGGSSIWRAVSELNFVLQTLFLVLTGRQRRRGRVLAVSPGTPFTVLAAVLCTRRSGRCVTIVHDVQAGLASAGGAHPALVKAMAVVERWILNRTDGVTVLSPGMAGALEASGVVVPVSVEPLWPTVGESTTAPDEDLVLYSGSLGRKQGVSFLLDVAEELERRRPATQLVIRGDGSERAELAAELRTRGLRNVSLAGLVDEKDLADSLARAAVHVVPQLAEGATAAMPSKIYNILAVGRPLVAAAAPDSGIRDLAADVAAVRCVPPGDVEGFAAEVVALLDHPEERQRIGREAVTFIERHRSRTSAMHSYLAWLDDA